MVLQRPSSSSDSCSEDEASGDTGRNSHRRGYALRQVTSRLQKSVAMAVIGRVVASTGTRGTREQTNLFAVCEGLEEHRVVAAATRALLEFATRAEECRVTRHVGRYQREGINVLYHPVDVDARVGRVPASEKGG